MARRIGYSLIVVASALLLLAPSTLSGAEQVEPADAEPAALVAPFEHESRISCTTYLFGNNLGTLASDVVFRVSAPTSFTPGESVAISVDVDPGIPNGPIAINAGQGYRPYINFLTTGAVANSNRVQSPTGGVAASGGTLVFDPMVGEVATPSDSTGLELNATLMRIAQGNIVIGCLIVTPFTIDIPTAAAPATTTTTSTTTTTDPNAPTTTIDPNATTTTTSTPTTTTTVKSTTTTTTTRPTTTTTASTTTTTPATTVAPTTPASTTPPAVAAQVITESASVEYTCEVFLNGAAVTTQTSALTATITAIDRVSVGGTIEAALSFDPGPRNGPLAFDAGDVTYRSELIVSGAGGPSRVAVGPATNPAAINASVLPDGPFVNYPIPAMSGIINATGAAGETFTLAPGNIDINIASYNSETSCTPASSAALTTTQIVAEAVTQPPGDVLAVNAERTTAGAGSRAAGSSLAATGVESSNTRLIAILLMAVGSALVVVEQTIAARRRRA